MEKFTFGLTDLTSFDQPAGEGWLDAKGAARRSRLLARRLRRSMSEAMLSGLCVVAFDGEGRPSSIIPLATVH